MNNEPIPSIMDGLTTCQRKVIFQCFKRSLINEVRVIELANAADESRRYIHRELYPSWEDILFLAQDFVGSHNINLLEPIGEFATRLDGGTNYISPYHRYTKLSRLVNLIFHPDDMPILYYLRYENQLIEPTYFLPIIPLVLVNRLRSDEILNYDPLQLIANIRNLIDNRPLEKMIPWCRGFKGTITEIAENSYEINGKINSLGKNTLEITELPLRVWTKPYKENVIKAMHNSDLIETYEDLSDDTRVRFIIKMAPQKYSEAEAVGFQKFFKLQERFQFNGMFLVDENGARRRYETTEEILHEYFNNRFEYYNRRRAYNLGLLTAQASRLDNQARFVEEIINGDIQSNNLLENATRKYNSDPVAAFKTAWVAVWPPPDDNEDYEYLTSMPIVLTTECADRDALRSERDALYAEWGAKNAELRALEESSPGHMWLYDLDQLEKALNEFYAEENIRKENLLQYMDVGEDD